MEILFVAIAQWPAGLQKVFVGEPDQPLNFDFDSCPIERRL
jgi:hypothetical protein